MQRKANNSTSRAAGELFFPKKPFRGYGGVQLPHLKGTENCESEILPLPSKVVISMQQHVGPPCEPLVKAGDTVEVGQPIGDNKAYICAPIHASVSGTVTAISEIMLPSGVKTKAVVIESDGKQTVWSGVKPPQINNVRDLCAAVRASGLVGLGGAGFPAHVKFDIPEGKSADTLVINGAECEPFLTADYREMVECGEDVLEALYFIKDIMGIERVIIGVESNKPEAIRILTEIADNVDRDPDDIVRVLKIKTSYPQGAEKVLINSCTGRRVPKGKLPIDVGCIVMNISTISFIAKYLKTGMPLVTKRLTVDGGAILEPKNVIAPIGTPISDIVAFCGGYKAEPRKLLMGGPMMGLAMYDEDTPILKQNNGIVIFAADGV
ncbi:MAG: RnfABCDGE type electron transport complex subunit C, partial [Clostridia bacterium]|nr:RnfABCDGE type electron transport complex subunit C [Clostridia bacterium]